MVMKKRVRGMSLFRRLFSNESKVRELYDSVVGNRDSEGKALTLIGYDSYLLPELRNSIEFSIEDKHIIIAEHQTEFVQIVERNREIDQRHNLEIIILYTGIEHPLYENYRIARTRIELLITKDIPIRVIDARYHQIDRMNGIERNEFLEEASPLLKEYCMFIRYLFHYYGWHEPLEDCVPKTIDECIREGILVDFLVEYEDLVVYHISRNQKEEEIACAEEIRNPSYPTCSPEKALSPVAEMLLNEILFDEALDYACGSDQYTDEDYRKLIKSRYNL